MTALLKYVPCVYQALVYLSKCTVYVGHNKCLCIYTIGMCTVYIAVFTIAVRQSHLCQEFLAVSIRSDLKLHLLCFHELVSSLRFVLIPGVV